MKATQVKALPSTPILHCEICHKPMQAAYGSWRDSDGSCSKKCEALLEEKKREEINSRFTSPSG